MGPGSAFRPLSLLWWWPCVRNLFIRWGVPQRKAPPPKKVLVGPVPSNEGVSTAWLPTCGKKREKTKKLVTSVKTRLPSFICKALGVDWYV